MRKKSHISLARYMVQSFGDENLRKHRFAFYLGSILPDIKPSFIYKRHEMEGTYPAVRRQICRLTEGKKLMEKECGRKYYLDLGQVSHYLADYFTYPHNKIYPGNLKAHCSYEEKLKRDLRAYIQSREGFGMQVPAFHVKDAQGLCDYIQKYHDDYLVREHGVADDIEHIVEINCGAVAAMIALLAAGRAQFCGQV